MAKCIWNDEIVNGYDIYDDTYNDVYDINEEFCHDDILTYNDRRVF